MSTTITITAAEVAALANSLPAAATRPQTNGRSLRAASAAAQHSPAVLHLPARRSVAEVRRALEIREAQARMESFVTHMHGAYGTGWADAFESLNPNDVESRATAIAILLYRQIYPAMAQAVGEELTSLRSRERECLNILFSFFNSSQAAEAFLEDCAIGLREVRLFEQSLTDLNRFEQETQAAISSQVKALLVKQAQACEEIKKQLRSLLESGRASMQHLQAEIAAAQRELAQLEERFSQAQNATVSQLEGIGSSQARCEDILDSWETILQDILAGLK